MSDSGKPIDADSGDELKIYKNNLLVGTFTIPSGYAAKDIFPIKTPESSNNIRVDFELELVDRCPGKPRKVTLEGIDENGAPVVEQITARVPWTREDYDRESEFLLGDIPNMEVVDGYVNQLQDENARLRKALGGVVATVHRCVSEDDAMAVHQVKKAEKLLEEGK